jgi:2-phospho-L-lactate guanylyltransferase (CobY/MobA/RfbA family)
LLPTDLYYTAVLLFSRSAAEEARIKPLISRRNARTQRTVSAHLIRHARHIAQSAGFPVFEISAAQQQGNNFGERFANAFAQLFARGFERVISIGNDCPTLTTSDILRAAAQLEHAHMVFGPAADGGAYLVGLRREAFAERTFANLAWQTDYTLAALKAHAEGDFQLLTEKSDLDSADDLRRALRSTFFPVFLKKRLLALLHLYVEHPTPSFLLPPAPAWRIGAVWRGPPQVAV